MMVMNLTIFDRVAQLGQEHLTIDAASLYRAFEQVKDGRGKKGKRYPLALLFPLIILGKMIGMTELNQVVAWIDERKSKLKQLLHWPKDFPTNKTYINAFAKCDYREVVQGIVKARAMEQCHGIPQKLGEGEHLIHTAVDGKVLRGTLKQMQKDQPPVHLSSFYECESGIVLDQFLVDKKKNEELVEKSILHPVLVKGRILMTDAMFTSRGWCAAVDAYEGYYRTPIKGNNTCTLYDIYEYFGDEELLKAECEYARIVEKGHGRIEVREIWASTGMNEFFQREWAGIAQIFIIRRTVQKQGKKSVEIICGITNLPRKKANARRLLVLNREYWFIENKRHYRRDMALHEDASQIRRSGVPQVFAALNGGILACMDWLGMSNISRQMIHFDAHPQKALQLLLGKLSRENG
ncbi:MAG TPA: ISAs1 family transposase [Ktedonobacteraceae bacterium]